MNNTEQPPTATGLSVVLVDDHTLFRTGLHGLLTSRGLTVLEMTGDARQAAGIVSKVEPDIVLLDLRMRELTGLEVLREIRANDADQCVVILTTSVEQKDLLDALRLGATGYLLKDMDPDQFVQQLHQARAGETVVAPDLTGLLARVALGLDSADSGAQGVAIAKENKLQDSWNLTPRETEILRHIAQGASNKDIANTLGIVDGTVKLHVRAVLKKLGVQSRVQAAVLAVSERVFEDG